jgi:nucleotide-binding universal stress UspA family protein
MYNTILVPLDGSERAELILKHVEDIAQHYQAKVVFLEVIEPPQTVVAPDGIYVPDQNILEERRQEVETYLAAKHSEFREKGINATVHIAYGRVVDEIIETAERENADLVAMASHGRTGLARVFYGSVAAGVLHRIDRPLLLIRADN